jgi:hypothetical protein
MFVSVFCISLRSLLLCVFARNRVETLPKLARKDAKTQRRKDAKEQSRKVAKKSRTNNRGLQQLVEFFDESLESREGRFDRGRTRHVDARVLEKVERPL